MDTDHASAMLRFYDGFNRHDLDAISACLSEGFVSHFAGTESRAAFLGFMQGFFEAFPDLHVEVLDVVGESERVAARILATGTHQGEFNGIPATGRSLELEGSDFWRVDADGNLCEHWGHADNLSMMQQLGVIPA